MTPPTDPQIAAKRYEPGFASGSNVLHLTRTLLSQKAICGYYPVDMLGIPADAVVCDECDRLSVDADPMASLYVKALVRDDA